MRKTILATQFGLLLALSGCVAPQYREPIYSLTEPAPIQLHYRVSEDDVLDLLLTDGSMVRLTVEKVDEAFIHGQDGRFVAIDDIQLLRCLDMTDASDAALGILVYTVMVPVSILAFPVVLPMALLYDWDKLEQWPDDRVCRITEHPEHYGYQGTEVNTDDASRPTLQLVKDEVGRRELTCDPIERAERYCAYFAQSGDVFNDCAGQMAALELGGNVGFIDWSASALCQVDQRPEQYDPLGQIPSSQPQTVVEAARAEIKRRELTCPPVMEDEPSAQ